jgi:hypothetical protein
MSVADMLAAARGGPAAAKPHAESAKAGDTGFAATKPPAVKPPPASGAKMTVEQMLAAARGGATAPKPPAKAPPAPKPADEPASAREDEGEPTAPPAPEKPAAKPAASGKVDRSTMSVADMIAWCRQHDAK